MNQHFLNDDYLLFIFNDEDSIEVKPLYSRYEEYALYKGMNRFEEILLIMIIIQKYILEQI